MTSRWQSVVFIDLDNTIMEGPFESLVFPTIFRELSEKTGMELSEVRRHVVKENMERQKQPGFSAVLAMDWDDIFKSVADNHGVQLDGNSLEIINSHSGLASSLLMEDADKVLRQLAKPNRAIVAATKGLRKYQIPVLDTLGITPLFSDLLTPDTNNVLKQDIAFYSKWLHLTDMQISVGDHYEDDVVAPKSFGFKVIWKPNRQIDEFELESPFDRPAKYDYLDGQSIRPDAIIISLQELPQVVRHLEER